jgi:MFS family permease
MEPALSICVFCGKQLALADVVYTPDARTACAPCSANHELFAADANVGSGIVRRAVFAVVAGPLAFVVMLVPSLPFLLLGLVLAASAIGAGISALIAVNRKGDARFTQHIAQHRGTVYACSIIGIVIGAIAAIILIFALIAWLFVRDAREEAYRYRGDMEYR